MKRLFPLALLFACLLCLALRGLARQPGTAPSIVIGLSDPTSYSKMLPLPAPVNGIIYVHPDARNRVYFRALVTGTGIRLATITAPHAAGSMYCSPTAKTFIGVAWDVSRVASGTAGKCTVTATDSQKRTTAKSVTVTLQK